MSALLFIVSAPSGTGKTTLVERLVRDMPGIAMSRSFTSRPPRHGEADGVDYNFISRERFEAMIANGDLLDSKRVGRDLRLLAGRGFVLLPSDANLSLDRGDGCGMIATRRASIAA